MALQGLSSLNLNTTTNIENDSNENAVDNGANVLPIESLVGLKRMLLATTAAGNNNDDTNDKIAAAAEGAVYYALHQHLHPTNTEERQALLHDIAKAAFIASPRAVLTQITQIISATTGGATKHAAALCTVALHFLERHLLVTVHDQEVDIKESLLFVNKEEEDEEEAQRMVLLAALQKKKPGVADEIGNSDEGDDDGHKWAVSCLQTMLEHSLSTTTTSLALVNGLKAVIQTLSPRLPSPPAAAAGGAVAGAGSKHQRSTGSLSPKLAEYTITKKKRGRSRAKNTPPLPPSGSSRLPKSLPLSRPRAQVDARTALVGGASKWSSRGPTPTLEEGELGELDEGELPLSSQKQQQQQREVPRGGGGDRDRERDRGRRRESPSPYPPLSSSYRDRRDDRERNDYRGGDRDRERETRGPRPHSRERERDRLSERDRERDMRSALPPPASTQKVSGRGMPPLEYAGKALWVGQVPLGHGAERELVDAFARYGPLASHHIIARSSCAFINYVDVESAIEARERLDGARVAGSTLVVEFKGEKRYWESREGRERDRERVERERGGGGGGDREREYRGDRERDRDRSDYITRPSPFTGGGIPPLPPRRGRGSRSRSRSPGGGIGGGGDGRRRNSFGGGLGDGGGWHNPSGRLYSAMSQDQLPSLPLPSSQNQPLHPALAASGDGVLAWQGSLGKSRQPQAEVACIIKTSLPPPGWAGAEPAGWPAMLDVQNRISTAYVLNTLLPALPPAERAVLRLIPSPTSQLDESARLNAFSSYLQGKQRTGVVDLGPGPQPGAPRQRVLYLIPASEEACRALGHMSGGGTSGEFMFAVVAAKSDEPGGMH